MITKRKKVPPSSDFLVKCLRRTGGLVPWSKRKKVPPLSDPLIKFLPRAGGFAFDHEAGESRAVARPFCKMPTESRRFRVLITKREKVSALSDPCVPFLPRAGGFVL